MSDTEWRQSPDNNWWFRGPDGAWHPSSVGPDAAVSSAPTATPVPPAAANWGTARVGATALPKAPPLPATSPAPAAGRSAPKRKAKARGGCGTVVAVIVLIAVIGGIIGGNSGTAPKSFSVSDSTVAALVKNVINNNSDSPGLSSAPIVSCRANGSHCNIFYTIKEPAGISAGLELIVPTAQIWKGLFEDPRFQSGFIGVSGPLVSQGGKSSTGPMFTLACNRSDADQIDWDHVDAHGIQSICSFDQLISSL